MTTRRAARHLLAAALMLPVQARAQCAVQAAESCVITLVGEDAPRASPSCLNDPWTQHVRFTLPKRFSDSNADGVPETVVELDLTPDQGCACVRIQVTLDAEPSGWLINIGDSPTNDGHGGDGGTTAHCAEVDVQEEEKGSRLAVYGSVLDASWTRPERLLLLRNLELSSSTFTFAACDQSLVIDFSEAGSDSAPLRHEVSPIHSQSLFALSGQKDFYGVRKVPDYTLHAAFNRVISDLVGAPGQGRVGRGVREVRISMTP